MGERFAIGSKVKIIELEVVGRVVGVYENTFGIRYEVRYLFSGDAKFVYFFEDELQAVK